jgi:hypothetical protein
MFILQNYKRSKQKPYERMKMLAIQDKAKHKTGKMRRLNVAAVKLTTVQVTALPLQKDLSKLRHHLQYVQCKAWTDEDAYILPTLPCK